MQTEDAITMGKNEKRKKSQNAGDTKTITTKTAAKKLIDANPLLTAQQRFLSSLSHKTRTRFFSPTHVTPEARAKIWEAQADVGEELVNSYAWATPDPRLLKVFQHFGPIVEVGCGANAYWSKWMNSEGGVDVVAFDVSLDVGGKIATEKSKKKSKKNKANDGNSDKKGGLVIRQGGPEVLSGDAEIRDSDRTLFLCYPDEDVQQDNDDEEEGDAPPISMAAACLEHFTGSTIIHVGELYGDTLSLEQAPFGRSSSNEFQQRLAGEYHCILKMKLEYNWVHVRDTLSVWKRSETCCMAFQNDDDSNDDEEEDEEVYYKHIPPEEVLPVDCAAPCVAHLLGKRGKSSAGDNVKAVHRKPTPPNIEQGAPKEEDDKSNISGKKRKKKKKSDDLAGNAW